MRVLVLILSCALAFLPTGAGNQIFFGPSSAQCLDGTADASTSNWTVTGDANHFGATDDAENALCLRLSGDTDTSYIECANSNVCADTFDVQNTSGLSAQRILYVTATMTCRNSTFPGSANATVSLRVSSTNYSAVTSSCASSTYQEATGSTKHYVNPATGVAWTVSDVDALQIVLDRPDPTGDETTRISAVGVVVAYEAPEAFGAGRLRSGGGS